MRLRHLLPALLLVLLPGLAAAQGLTVFAAASLTDAMNDVSAAWVRAGHAPLRLSYGSSSTLAKQIEQGAPAAMFASADERWMDDLAQHGMVVDGTRRDLLGNALVMIAPKDAAAPVAIGPGLDLAARLGPSGRLAVGDPAHVPVGLYAKQALTKLGLWSQVESRIAPTDDVRAGMLLVERGEAPLGVVYATDAAAGSGITVVGTFPASSHEPITYPFAIVRGGDDPEAKALMRFLGGAQAAAIFSARGFSVLPAAGAAG